ncbi:MAG: DNA polymerase III subunit delta [Buchnera aphidicola (Brevicoryne brassicae)]|uniref:DNA polymerase III subunit delta n=1 Tax=Buchnera aphidicola (Brevicoryne brassicae) TaxID=911343 RepID=A0AAJ5PUH4_9GAMM|nr:DNA polymerase III subunit delta [Buchnera aphidicola]QCI19997.1 DNA polymerase III subunit delta [Buchnera aphidicola (Brevicoryne brassicae)]WAI18822.1 MAG: DNA polymerase III subunit delta [Buchnera aphidicola (Brevicoryne brassicae)]
MNIINPEKLKQNLIKKLNSCYVFLGEDFCLLEKNQNLILNFANQKGFTEIIIIDVEKNEDWKKIFNFYKKRNLFFKKTTLVVNLIIKKLNIQLIKNINEIHQLFHLDILIILKFNHLSCFFEKSKSFDVLKNHVDIISCFTPYNANFINWIKYEISEKNIKIEEKAFFLLCKYYEGNTLFIYKTLDTLSTTWPNTYIKVEKIKKIIINFLNFLPIHWINAIFQNHKIKAIYILDIFCKKQYNPLILIRSLQKDLLILIYIKREKQINIDMFLKKNNVGNIRYKFFKNALKKINNKKFLKAIRILLKIEISIKKQYNSSVWIQLFQLTLTLC